MTAGVPQSSNRINLGLNFVKPHFPNVQFVFQFINSVPLPLATGCRTLPIALAALVSTPRRSFLFGHGDIGVVFHLRLGRGGAGRFAAAPLRAIAMIPGMSILRHHRAVVVVATDHHRALLLCRWTRLHVVWDGSGMGANPIVQRRRRGRQTCAMQRQFLTSTLACVRRIDLHRTRDD